MSYWGTRAPKPVVAANPDDGQAFAMLTRGYAQAGDRLTGMPVWSKCSFSISAVLTPPPSLKDYAVEWIKAGDNALSIRTSLEH